MEGPASWAWAFWRGKNSRLSEAVRRLRKVLTLERSRQFADTAVIGGGDAFPPNFPGGAAPPPARPPEAHAAAAGGDAGGGADRRQPRLRRQAQEARRREGQRSPLAVPLPLPRLLRGAPRLEAGRGRGADRPGRGLVGGRRARRPAQGYGGAAPGQ